MDTLLDVQNVCLSYHTLEGETRALSNISFQVKQGEFLAIVGPSGCGKSTLLDLICHLLTPESGTITLKSATGGKDEAKIGYMLQKDHLLEWRSVYQNVILGLEIRHQLTPDKCSYVDHLLKLYGLDKFKKARPSQLSGGMRQRAAFARTVLTGSDLLLLDEPFSALDYLTRLSMREWLLEQWEKEKKTVLFITHDVEEAVFLSSRILVVEQSPITHLRSIEVPAGYPRSREELRRPEILSLKEELIGMLKKEKA